MEGDKITALIYNDEGTSHVDTFINALDFLFKSLKSKTKILNYEIFKVSADEARDGFCFKNANIFIVPGGRDLPYVKKLGDRGVRNIKDFVAKGGRYFGVCAGAYFASSFCEFEKGTKMEVCGKRDLGLYPGKAKGSVYTGFQYNSEAGARIVAIKLEKCISGLKHDRSFQVYHNGGCEFFLGDGNKSEDIRNVAKYVDFPDKVAITLCRYGHGKVLLSGVHPEMNYKFLTNTSQYSKEQLQALHNISVEQEELFEILLTLILT